MFDVTELPGKVREYLQGNRCLYLGGKLQIELTRSEEGRSGERQDDLALSWVGENKTGLEQISRNLKENFDYGGNGGERRLECHDLSFVDDMEGETSNSTRKTYG